MKAARITINPRGIGVLAFRLSSRRLSAPITTAALLGSVGAGSAFARPARNASDNELTSLWPAGLEIASPSCTAECHKKSARPGLAVEWAPLIVTFDGFLPLPQNNPARENLPD